jgi:hypothetical protein
MSPVKKGHMYLVPSLIFGFFSTTSKFKKANATQVGLLEDLMMFVIKRLMPLRTIESI